MEINFFENLDECNFEYFLKKNFNKSCAKNTSQIVFNTENVAFINAWSAILMLVWMSFLKKSNKVVEFKAPLNLSIRRFLINSRFEKILNQMSIISHNFKYGDYSLQDIKSEDDEILPFISFNSQNSFETYFSNLSDSNIYFNSFNKINSESFVKEGDLRNIFIKELGFNFKEHSKASNSFVGMMLYKPKNVESSIRKLHVVAPWMVDFYREVGADPTVELLVADDGIGLINSNLINLYKKELDKVTFDEVDILNYAFLFHTTTKSQEERVGKILDSISTDNLSIDILEQTIATGLYYVKELSSMLNAFLMIRSGKTICYYNFLNSQKPYFQNVNLKRCKNTTGQSFFPGLQYKIIVPIIKRKKKYFDYYKIDNRSDRIKLKYISEIINFSDYIVTPAIHPEDEPSAIKMILQLSEDLTHKLSQRNNIDLDAINFIYLNLSDVSMNERLWQFFYSTILCLPLTNKHNPFCLINVKGISDNQVAFQSIKKMKSQGYLKKIIPALCFDRNFAPSFIGCDENYENELINSLKCNNMLFFNNLSVEFRSSMNKSPLFQTFTAFNDIEED